jgi:hypothetical protein
MAFSNVVLVAVKNSVAYVNRIYSNPLNQINTHISGIGRDFDRRAGDSIAWLTTIAVK